jgi:hypothetical protein
MLVRLSLEYIAWVGNRRDKAKVAVWVKIREYFLSRTGQRKTARWSSGDLSRTRSKL